MAVIILSLLALVLVPLRVQRQTWMLREEIARNVEPAQALTTDVQYALAREMSLLRGFLVTGNGAFLDHYQQIKAWEEKSAGQLAPLVGYVSPEASVRFGELRALAAHWHRAVAAAEVVRLRRVPTDLASNLPFEQRLYEQTLAAATRLDQAVSRAADLRIQQIGRAEHQGLAFTIGLVGLALISVCLVGWLGSRIRLASREAQQGRREAIAAMESKARLMRGITHDLKNPLGVVDGYAELLELGLKGELTPEQRALIGRMRLSVRLVLDAVGDLLELSRVEAGLLKLAHEPLNIAQLVRDATDTHRVNADGAGLDLQLKISEPLPITYTDDRRVRQILDNLFECNQVHAFGGTDHGSCRAAH
jgi:signal transduction histidine kinase